ncbi:uncharacterized protein LOC110906796 [Helianthus annuus]|uniref:uncharacterized protein LOC110906796 n=1 Tax=Helianthus annuus TaxID=4232 RepID=UPI000B8F8DB4|nr:uncharacterized protein LOC110906796 [Helianthus annuus]
MTLSLADRSVKYPRGIVENLLVKVDKFVFLEDFVIIDIEADINVPLILGCPFLRNAKALIDVFDGKTTLRVGDKNVIFEFVKSRRHPGGQDDFSGPCDSEQVKTFETQISTAEALVTKLRKERKEMLSAGEEKNKEADQIEEAIKKIASDKERLAKLQDLAKRVKVVSQKSSADVTNSEMSEVEADIAAANEIIEKAFTRVANLVGEDSEEEPDSYEEETPLFPEALEISEVFEESKKTSLETPPPLELKLLGFTQMVKATT